MKSHLFRKTTVYTILILTLMLFSIPVSAKASAKSQALTCYSKAMSSDIIKLKDGGIDTSICKFAVVDLTLDNVPELLVFEKEPDDMWLYFYIFTYKSGKLSQLYYADGLDYTRSKDWKVSKRKGIIYVKNGSGESLIHVKKSGKIERLACGIAHGDNKLTYHFGNKTLSKSSYNKLKKQWLKNAGLSTLIKYSNTSKNRKKYLK